MKHTTQHTTTHQIHIIKHQRLSISSTRVVERILYDTRGVVAPPLEEGVRYRRHYIEGLGSLSSVHLKHSHNSQA
jgi:hypothetical protein